MEKNLTSPSLVLTEGHVTAKKNAMTSPIFVSVTSEAPRKPHVAVPTEMTTFFAFRQYSKMTPIKMSEIVCEFVRHLIWSLRERT